MKLINIIQEALDLTALQSQIAILKKNKDEMVKAISANPLLAKEYATQLNNMNVGMDSLNKTIGAMTSQQQIDSTAAVNQQRLNVANAAKPGTSVPLAKQGTTPSLKPPVAPTVLPKV